MFNRKSNTVTINLPGGIVSAGQLYTILEVADNAKVANLQLGTRQQLFLNVSAAKLKELEKALYEAGIGFETDAETCPNIVSSYVNEGVFENSNWLSEGVYKDVLNLFDYKPKLKLNLVDGAQTFIPYFTGNLNFIASNISNYWYLYIRFKSTNTLYAWPVLIYSNDIPKLSIILENQILTAVVLGDEKEQNGDLLYSYIVNNHNFITQPVSQPLQLPEFMMPYYEGFNRYGNKTWLGIYRRDELFSVAFLKDICSACMQSKIGQLYTTPWKSFIIKGIGNADRNLWGYVLSKHRINVRHAANELNWQVEDLCEEGLNLKRYLVRQLDKDDLRTFGLCFAIKTEVQSGLWGSVVIQKQTNTSLNQRKAMDRYDILYTKNFNPNSKDYILFRSNIEKEHLPTYLASLCKYFYELKNEEAGIIHNAYRQNPVQQTHSEPPPLTFIHQCSDCFTVYDAHYGDSINNIAAGTPFDAVGNTYHCSVCDASKSSFNLVVKKNNTAIV